MVADDGVEFAEPSRRERFHGVRDGGDLAGARRRHDVELGQPARFHIQSVDQILLELVERAARYIQTA